MCVVSCFRNYVTRKQGAESVENIIKEIQRGEGDSSSQINLILKILINDFAYSKVANSRKGGLIGLAATAIALMDETTQYLSVLLPPVLECFEDTESRVRYYACEALYNITKVTRENVLLYFNEIFDGLCKLYADPDGDVKSASLLYDRLVKDVVTESESFDMDKFIPLLQERIKIKNPYIRQLIVGWITVLDSVPDIDMLEYLPDFLGGLFDMLSDDHRDIRQQAFNSLADLLRETKQTVHVDLGPMVMILVERCERKDSFTRSVVLGWVLEFIKLGQARLLPFCAAILGAALNSISDPEKDIRVKAERANNLLLQLVKGTDASIDLKPLLEKVTSQLLNKWVPSRIAALRWIAMLLTKMPQELYKYLNDFFPALMKTLQDPDDDVVRLDLEVLARISLNRDGTLNQENFEMVLNSLMQRFRSERRFLEARGSLIIRQLSVFLNGESIYRTLARIIQNSEDVEFASLMVQTLNLILLTSIELFELRILLKKSLVTPEGRDLFNALYSSWAHNPVATFSLCLLAQAYELASALVFQIADIEVTVGFLMQIDKLVQLLESPIFIHLRLQLLEADRYPFLLKSLYGLLMLLPQSAAFSSLKIRLSSVAALSQVRIPESEFAVSNNTPVINATASPIKQTEAQRLDFRALLQQFHDTQKRHHRRRQTAFHRKSLMRRVDTPGTDETNANGASSLDTENDELKTQ